MVSVRVAQPAFIPNKLSMLFIPSDLRSGRLVAGVVAVVVAGL